MYCFLKCEGMADQGIEVDISRLQQPDRIRPGVMISIDEFQVNLPGSSSVNPASNAATLRFKVTRKTDLC